MKLLLEQFINVQHLDILFSIIALMFVFHFFMTQPFERMFDFLANFKLKDVNSDEVRLLNENNIFNIDLRDSLNEYFEHVVFYRAYGIRATKEMRTELVNFYSRHKDEINWTDIKAAYRNIKLDGSNLVIESSILNTFYLLFINLGLTIAGVMLLFSVGSYLLFDGGDQALKLSAIILVYSFLFSFMRFMARGFRSIDMIQDCLCEEHEKKLIKGGRAN